MLVAGALRRDVELIVNRRAQRLVDEGPRSLREAIVGAAAAARVHETRSLAELGRVADDIARRAPELVVLAGGDGSYMAGVTALARACEREGTPLPAFAFAPGGTVSTVARNWGLRGELRSYARRLVRAAIDGGGILTRRETLHVVDDDGDARIGFIFGAGLVASFFDVYYASPRHGYAGAASIVLRIFAGSFAGGALARKVLEPSPCVLTVDGVEQAPRAWSLVAASVVRDLGLHMLVTYRAGEVLGRFHAVASPLPPRELGPQMFRVLAGRPLAGARGVDTLARELRVSFTSARGAYVLDGDLVRARSVVATPGPVIRVLAV